MLMKKQFRMFRRGNLYWCQNNQAGKQESLHTSDKEDAQTILNAKNEAHRQPNLNFQIARAYLVASDSEIGKRTWATVMEEAAKLKKGPTRSRCLAAIRDSAFDQIRTLPLLQTNPTHFFRVLEEGTVSTNMFLRRFHNFALDMNWLPWPVLPRKRWPKVSHKEKRAITLEEHQQIVEREPNAEMKAFYQLCWHLGGSQSDIATLHAEDVDWTAATISYSRKKTERNSQIRFGNEVAALLHTLPVSGALFPRLANMHERHRAKEFNRRCKGLGIKGVSLHCYRYSWAQRAKACGFPERFAQQALGQSSKAVHRAYAKKVDVIVPSLEEYEALLHSRKVVPAEFQTGTAVMPDVPVSSPNVKISTASASASGQIRSTPSQAAS